MPDAVQSKPTVVKSDGDLNQKSTSVPAAKEKESQLAEEGKIMAEIRTREAELDEQALEEVQKEVQEAKQSHPQPVLPADVEDAGVVAPSLAAEEVVKKGSEIVLPIDEQSYKRGLHQRVTGVVVNQVVVGVSSIIGLVLLVGKLIKMAHKHAMKIIFKGGSGD